jgi:hypothetical protein
LESTLVKARSTRLPQSRIQAVTNGFCERAHFVFGPS